MFPSFFKKKKVKKKYSCFLLLVQDIPKDGTQDDCVISVVCVSVRKGGDIRFAKEGRRGGEKGIIMTNKSKPRAKPFTSPAKSL